MNAHTQPHNWTYETVQGYGENGKCCTAESVVSYQPDPNRKLLKSAILRLGALAKERDYGAASPKSIFFAYAFAENLPSDYVLPKVAVDEEGDVLMIWGVEKAVFALTIEKETLHMVINPGAEFYSP